MKMHKPDDDPEIIAVAMKLAGISLCRTPVLVIDAGAGALVVVFGPHGPDLKANARATQIGEFIEQSRPATPAPGFLTKMAKKITDVVGQ